MGSSASIVLGGGCFWCIEAVFQRISGVLSVTSGYAGGHVANPTYEQVCSGRTGHAEVVRIVYDAGRISLQKILEHFFACHDPTTLNRQGADEGTQYRSIVFFASNDERSTIETVMDGARAMHSRPIVTEIAPLGEFYPAEPYHQNYFSDNPASGYCRYVIAPKLEKLGL